MAAAGGDEMAVSVLLRAVDQVTGPVRRMQGQLNRFNQQARAIGQRAGFSRITNGLRRARMAGTELIGVTGRLATKLGALPAAGAAVGGATVHSFAQMANESDEVSKRLGITTEELTRLQYVGKQFGVQAEAMRDGLKELSLRTAEFVEDGAGPAKWAMNELRLSQQELAEASNDTGELFKLVQSRLRGVENVAKRQRLVDEIFGGQGGEQLAEMASISAEKFRELMRESDAMNATVGKEGAKAAGRYMKAWRGVTSALGGVRNTIGKELAPVFADLLTRVKELVVEYRPQIKQWAEAFAERLPETLASLKRQFNTLMERLQPVVEFGGKLVDRFGAVNTAAAGLAVVVGGPLIAPMLKLVGAMGTVGAGVLKLGTALVSFSATAITALKALAAAALANPITATVLAIATAAGLLYAYWDKVAPFFREVWTSVTNVVSRAWEQLTGWLGWDPLTVLQPAWDAVVGYVSRLMGAVIRLFKGDLSALQDLFTLPLEFAKQGFGAALDWLSGLNWSKHGRKLLSSVASGIKATAMAPFNAVSNALAEVRSLLPFSDAKKGPLSTLTKSGKALVQTLADGVTAGRSALLSKLEGLASAAKDAVSGAWEAVKGFFSDSEEGGRAPVQPELGKLPELPQLTGQAKYEVMLGKLPTLPDLSATMTVGAQGPQPGAAVDALRQGLPQAAQAPAANDGGETPEPAPQVAAGGGGAAEPAPAPAARGGVTVQRVDFKPQVTIQAPEGADAEEIADIVDERLERYRSRELWRQAQSIDEAAD